MTRLPVEEVAFHPHSFGDPAGRLFLWRGELYRGVRQEAAPFAAELVQSVLPRLAENGLVPPTTLTDLSLEGFDLVLRHQQIPLAAYPTEWCAAMLREAALAYLDVLAELAELELGLKDVQPWNLVFDGHSPVFVDVMSIAPLNQTLPAFSEDRFRRYYLNPLLLMTYGHARIARCLLAEYDGVEPAALALLPRRARPWRLPRRRRPTPWPLNVYVDVLARLRQEVAAVQPPVATGSGKSRPEADAAAAAVADALEQLQPETVLDLHTTDVAPARLAADRGLRAVAFCSSDAAANAAFFDARAADRSLLPLLIDFTKPPAAVGYLDHYAMAAADRLQCELVVAFGAVDYALLRRALTFEHLAAALGSFSSKYALVAQPHAKSVPGEVAARTSSISSDDFVRALRARFDDVSPFESEASEPQLLLCRK